MDGKTALESASAELDLSVCKHSGYGSVRTKSRKNNERKHNEPSVPSSLGSLFSPSASLDPTHALMPGRSSISSLLSMSHLRLWENPITASAISAAAAMTHLMDINSTAISSPFGVKSSEEKTVNSTGSMCLICGRLAQSQNELENHMLTHSLEKPFQCLKYGLNQNRIQGLFMTSKKRKSKYLNENSIQALDVSVPDRKKRIDHYLNTEWRSPEGEDQKPNSSEINHSTNSMNTNAFPCTSCHKTFATEVDLKAHLMRHMTQHPFVCLACGKGFKYEHSLNFHIKSYHNSTGNNNDRNVVNNNMSSKTVSENETKEEISHKLSDQNIDKKCQTIDKTDNTSEMDYNDETSLDGEHSDEDNDGNDENHNKTEYLEFGAPPQNVGARSIQIKSEKLLITMLEGIHPITEQNYILYKCCLCGFAFPSLDPVILHLQASHLNTNKEFTCDKCGANFKWKSELTLHEQLHKAMDQNDKNGSHLSIPSFLQSNRVLMSPEFGHNLSPNHSFAENNNNIIINNNNNSVSEDKYRPHKKSILQTKSSKIKSESQHSSHSSDIKVEGIQNVIQMSHKFPTAIGDIKETSPGQFKCRFCDKTFDRIFSVHRHERVHTGFKPCICKTCGRGFSEKRNLRHHIIRFHSDGSGRELLKRNRKDKNLKNITASKVATSLKKAALKILNGSDGNDYDMNEINVKTESEDKCEDEDNDSQKESDLKNEQNFDEENKASIKCSENTNSTQNNSSSSARRRKGKPSKKIIPAQDFSPESSSLSAEDNVETQVMEEIQNNESNREEEESVTNADINPNDFLETKLRCHGAFFSSYNPRLGVVEKPVKRTEACRPLMGPDGKFLYPCTYCNKTFCSLSDLNRHMNFHEDVRPFKCEYCNYQSRTNSQLKVHMMRHAGIKQYLCQICNYNGVTQSDLNRHCKTRSHALRSANICPLCSLGFSTRTLLDDHIIKFHETSDASNSSDKFSKRNANCIQKTTSEQNHNRNEFSFSSKSFSMKEILN